MIPGTFSGSSAVPPPPKQQGARPRRGARFGVNAPTQIPSDEARQAGAELLRSLLELYSECKINARELCVLCDMCTRAGVPGGMFSSYSQPPGLQTGRYQQYLDGVLPKVENLTTIEVPMNQNRGPHRTVRYVPCQLVFDSIEQELRKDSTILETLGSAEPPDGVLTTRKYTEHPQLSKAQELGWGKPLPLAAYIDGVTFRQAASGRSDSTTGFWLTNVLSGTRYLVTVIRDSDLCSCGCRGWCSYWPVLNFMRWTVLTMQDHRRPVRKWDGSPWQAEAAGSELSYNACLLWIKGDWMEHIKTLGLAPFSQYHAPCQFCTQVKPELHWVAEGFSAPGGPLWDLRTHESYFEDCSKCEVVVQIATEDARRQLLLALGILRRGSGVHGMGVLQPIGTLQIGDRLEPSEQLQDTHSLWCAKLPLELTFWRPTIGSESKLPMDPMQHRSPLFDRRLNTSPANSLAIDELHCLHLGQMQRIISAVLWRCLLLNPRGLDGSQRSIIDRGVALLWADLQRFQEDPDNGITESDRLGNLTLKMLGAQKGRHLQEHVLCFRFPLLK